MNDEQFEALQAKERELWKRVEVVEAPYKAAISEWSNAHDELKEAEMERKIRARIEDKLQAERRQA